MAVKERTLRNPRRGTKVDYWTIPIEDANKITEKQFLDFLKRHESEMNLNNHTLGHDYNPSITYHEFKRAVDYFSRDENLRRYYPDVRLEDSGSDSPGFINSLPIPLKIARHGDKLVIFPHPFTHGVTTSFWGRNSPTRKAGGQDKKKMEETADSFSDLLRILTKGFYSEGSGDMDNVTDLKYDRRSTRKQPSHWGHGGSKGITSGDVYRIELFPTESEEYNPGTRFVKRTNPENILGINVYIDESNPKAKNYKKLLEKKLKFYKEQLKSYNLPVRFYIPDKYERRLFEGKITNFTNEYKPFYSSEGLERILSVVTVVSLFASVLFLSSNITGNVIGNLTNSTSNFIGAGFLVLGLVAGFFWIRNKK